MVKQNRWVAAAAVLAGLLATESFPAGAQTLQSPSGGVTHVEIPAKSVRKYPVLEAIAPIPTDFREGSDARSILSCAPLGARSSGGLTTAP